MAWRSVRRWTLCADRQSVKAGQRNSSLAKDRHERKWEGQAGQLEGAPPQSRLHVEDDQPGRDLDPHQVTPGARDVAESKPLGVGDDGAKCSFITRLERI